MIDILKYQGKLCVVTGAASGMGGACARILGELGCSDRRDIALTWRHGFIHSAHVHGISSRIVPVSG